MKLILTLLGVVLLIVAAVYFVVLADLISNYGVAMAADSDGKWLILGAILAQGLGYYIMRRIVDIKV